MPYLPKKACSWQYCSNLVDSGRCSEHAYKPFNRKRDKFYDSAGWKSIRREHLARNPLCAQCKDFVGMRGHVDHIIPKSRGGTESPWNLQTLCHSCHSKKTVAYDGGLGRDKKDYYGRKDT